MGVYTSQSGANIGLPVKRNFNGVSVVGLLWCDFPRGRGSGAPVSHPCGSNHNNSGLHIYFQNVQA